MEPQRHVLSCTIKMWDNGKAYSPTHGHLDSKAAYFSLSLLLAQGKLFYDPDIQTRDWGEGEKMIKKKKEGGVCISLRRKEKKHDRELLIIVCFFCGYFPSMAGNVDAQVEVLKSIHKCVFLKSAVRSCALILLTTAWRLAGWY